MSGEKLLSANQIVKEFPGTKALKGVSIDLYRGEVHAVAGENGAGKSTLMNIISGGMKQTKGELFIKGKEISFASPKDAQNQGVGLVHQELALFPELTVAENIFVERLPQKNGMIQREVLNQKAADVLSQFDSDIKPTQMIGELSVSQQQIVEIAKVVSADCEIIIFDEPTSSLNEEEAGKLFEIIEGLKKRGAGIFYISHKLSEIFDICDRITILRDGEKIVTHKVDEVTQETVVNEMVGREFGRFYPDKSKRVEDEVLLEVRGLSRKFVYEDISFCLKKGEILGFCGLVGSGRTEIARGICGIDKADKGTVFINGKEIDGRSYAQAIKNGLCYLTESRKEDGLFLEMDVSENVSALQLGNFSKRGILQTKEIEKVTAEFQKILNIKYSDARQPVNSLSGGNQQKIMIAKLLALHPKIIILDEPTRGIDVGSKLEIHTVLRELANKGIGVIVISSEMPEIVGVCDRVLIIREGKLIDDIAGSQVTQDNIVASISKGRQIAADGESCRAMKGHR